MYGEQKATLFAHVSWTLQYTRRVVHILDKKTFVSGKLYFMCIIHGIGHRSVTTDPLGYRSRVLRALNNTDIVLFGVRFAFLMYSYRSRELHDLDLWQQYSARDTGVHILGGALVVHGNLVICG